MAGGVAFNSVANGKVLTKTPFFKTFIQPAAGDAGTALGGAYLTAHQIDKKLKFSEMECGYWGPSYRSEIIREMLQHEDLSFTTMEDAQLMPWVASQLADGKIVGWFQGRMEYGPRALGNRSILADPRRVEMKEELNRRVKKRESFRPYAPAVLEKCAYEFFDMSGCLSPFMLMVFPVRSEMREKIPAVTHVDGTARVQTVTPRQNPRFYSLIEAFGNQTGVPVLLNTSFNENEPIVESPTQAIACFKRNEMDILVLENFVVQKESLR